MMKNRDLSSLPGSEFILKGISDRDEGLLTAESLLIEIGQYRLSKWIECIPAPLTDRTDEWAEIRLYNFLCDSGVIDPYRYYNSLLRKLVSFEQALES